MGEHGTGEGWVSAGLPGGADRRVSGLSGAERRMIRLIEEFRRRQRRRPNLVVRPWWKPADDGAPGRVGCVVEYCPGGRDSAELAVRLERVTVDGPASAVEAELDLTEGWVLDGRDTGSPETLVNYLLRMADGTLGEAA